MNRFFLCACLVSLSSFAIAQNSYSVVANTNRNNDKDDALYINIDEEGNISDEYAVEYDTQPVIKKTKRAEEVHVTQPMKPKKEEPKTLAAPRRVRYSGMVETGFGYEFMEGGFTWSLSTTHGAQIGNHFFIGAGVGYSLLPDYGWYDDWSHAIDFFADMRIYLAKGKCIPYFDFKGGVGAAVWSRYGTKFTGSYSAGFGLVIADYFDMRFAWTGRDELDECSLALKLGVRF